MPELDLDLELGDLVDPKYWEALTDAMKTWEVVDEPEFEYDDQPLL